MAKTYREHAVVWHNTVLLQDILNFSFFTFGELYYGQMYVTRSNRNISNRTSGDRCQLNTITSRKSSELITPHLHNNIELRIPFPFRQIVTQNWLIVARLFNRCLLSKSDSLSNGFHIEAFGVWCVYRLGQRV